MLIKGKEITSDKIIPYFFVGMLAILNILPVMAPILDRLGEKNFSSFIYWLYSFFCHQKASRSFFTCEHQNGWCARCTFMWLGIFLSAFHVFFPFIKTLKITRIDWRLALLLCLPMALDGTIQLIAAIYSLVTFSTPFYESTNSIRAITGGLFGLGLGLFMFTTLNRELKNEQAR